MKWNQSAFIGALGLLVISTASFVGFRFKLSQEPAILCVVGGFALWIGLVMLVFILRSRVIRHLERMRCLICRKCAYPLNVLPSEGKCPECGKTYTHAGTTRYWRAL